MTAIPNDEPWLEFCRSLLKGRVPEEAISFCGYLLPRRAAVWWGHECLDYLADRLDKSDLDLLAMVRAWFLEQGNPQQRAALEIAAARQERTPAAWIALAVANQIAEQNGGRPASKTLCAGCATARSVNAGILTGLARVATSDRVSVLTAFVEMGMQLAEFEALRTAGTASLTAGPS
jgi:hypothetical protein